MLDSGIRRGTDGLKALALGADFVFIGRPVLYAAAIGGEPGVRHAVKLLREEIDRDMAMPGISNLEQMTREMLVPSSGELAGVDLQTCHHAGRRPLRLFRPGTVLAASRRRHST